MTFFLLTVYFLSALIVIFHGVTWLFEPNILDDATVGDLIQHIVAVLFGAFFPILNTVVALCFTYEAIENTFWWNRPLRKKETD